MKILIASDIHGSASAARYLIGHFEDGKYDRIILAGDILYHGPRNDLPGEYNCMKTAELLNIYKDKIRSVRGNCDSEVDQMVLQFSITDDYAVVEADGKRLFISHGHIYGPGRLPDEMYDAMICGHTHVPMHEYVRSFGEYKGMLLCNPGSTSIPKGGSEAGYMSYENGRFNWHKLETGEIYDSVEM
ncbi:MAG: phosphodiesterase [Clostridiales bacterium]|nr:phosphodiesterase [Candidatus Crickella caballi]